MFYYKPRIKPFLINGPILPMQIVQRKKKTYFQRTHSEQGGEIKVQVGVDSHDLTRILHQSGREIKKIATL